MSEKQAGESAGRRARLRAAVALAVFALLALLLVLYPPEDLYLWIKVMERRLYRVIMQPAMGLSWLLGLYLAWSVYGFQGGWLHAKRAFVVLLSAVHQFYGRAVRAFAEDRNTKTGRQWRLWNEAPALLMILIVILVVVKPF